jgi:hypothetical protein
MNFFGRLAWLFVWGIAFGYIESAVVVYLRALYYPEGFAFPLAPIAPSILTTEIIREAATLILLWSTASLVYSRMQSRVAAFFILFGVWDIFYYVFLKALLDWPATLLTWDILFLIPLPWAGPVWAPILVSFGLILFSTAILYLNDHRVYLRFTLSTMLLLIAAACIIVVSFLIPGIPVAEGKMPGDFPSLLFWSGFLLGGAGYGYAITSRKKS